MRLSHFRYFIAVAEEGSFLKAARRLRVTQPSLSRQIQKLESKVGVPLLERRARGVKLTDAGAAFIVEARATLESAGRAVARARRADADTETQQTLVLAHGTLFYRSGTLANLIAAFRAKYSAVRVQVRRLNDAHQLAALREQRIDVATMFLDRPFLDGCGVHLLLKQPGTGAILPAAHRLAAKDVISVAELRELTLMHIDPRVAPSLYQAVMQGLSSRGLKAAHRRARYADPASAIIEIAAGASWMLASEAAAQLIKHNSGVVYRPFVEPPIPFWMGLVWRPNPPSEAIDSLIGVARDIGLHASAD